MVEKESIVIILRKTYYRNSSLILDAYSSGNERFSLYVRGCLDPKSKMYGVFDLFSLVRVTYRVNDSSDLHFVRSAVTYDDNYALSMNWPAQKIITSVLRVTSKLLRYDVVDKSGIGYFADICNLLSATIRNKCGRVASLQYLDSLLLRSGCGFVLPDDFHLFPSSNCFVFYNYAQNTFSTRELSNQGSFGLTKKQVSFLRQLRSGVPKATLSEYDYKVLFKFYQNYFAYYM